MSQKQLEFNMENLPNEIWCNVFSRLDEKSVRSATLTCKGWFGLIRNDPNLSRHICLKDHSLKEFLTKIEKSEWIWERWPALKTLELELDMSKAAGFEHRLKCPKQAMDLRKQINFKECPSLEKVFFPVHIDLTDFMVLNEDGSLPYPRYIGKVHKMCFNPKVKKDSFGIEDIYYLSLKSYGIEAGDYSVEDFCDTIKFIGETSKNIEHLKIDDSKLFNLYLDDATDNAKLETTFQHLFRGLRNSLQTLTVPNADSYMIPKYFLRPLSENCKNMNSLVLFSNYTHLFIGSSSLLEFWYKIVKEFKVPNFICINCLSHDCKIIIDMLLEKVPLGGLLTEEVNDLAFISHQFRKNKKCCMIIELWSVKKQNENDSLYEWQTLVNVKFQDIARVEINLHTKSKS